jgi:hypothetical protein
MPTLCDRIMTQHFNIAAQLCILLAFTHQLFPQIAQR